MKIPISTENTIELSDKKEKTMGFARFMSSLAGRLLRIVAGIAIIVVGLVVVHGTVGIILAIIGLVVLAAGLFNFCIFAPLFGGPFWAKDIK
jgi:uncharacterized protein YjeT (DUF2065 family)